MTTAEIYDVLRIRSEVFVVEQNCPYQDLDDKDRKAGQVHDLSLNDIDMRFYYDFTAWLKAKDIDDDMIREMTNLLD